MIVRQSSSEFSGDSSGFLGDESIRGGFTEGNVCGEGASCVVYHMNLQGLHLAVKRLREVWRDDPLYRASFRKEFLIGRGLKHDALPIYREFSDGPDEVYIVMDFIDGYSLSGFVCSEEGQLFFRSKENVERFLRELVNVVGYLHRKGVIHCDIKPDNLLLRHTDRGLMLIDFDKAYCDTFDRTSGGTPGFSDLLTIGDRPTSATDFLAIGKVFDYLVENVAGFPVRRFKHFRRECDRPDASVEKLAAALKLRSCGRALVLVVLFAIIGFFAYKILPDMSSEVTEEKFPDTVLIKSKELVLPEAMVAPESAVPVVIADFDKKMAEFSQEAQTSLDELNSGALTDEQIRNKMSEMVETYTAEYHAILTEYKAGHPEDDGINVELAVARAAENSRAFALLQAFTRAAGDTIKARHPGSY